MSASFGLWRRCTVATTLHQDTLTASNALLVHFSSALSVYASHEGTIREEMKAIRTREENLDELRRRRKSVFSDAEAAERVAERDNAVDDFYDSIFRTLLTHMMENPHTIGQAAHLLFVAKNLERVGDHATNIAETVHYAVRGDSLPEDRPKADQSASAVVRPLG